MKVDQYKWAILETEEDVHALTGCLKLFFRELKEPLIPFPLIEQALKAALYQGPQSERIRRYRGPYLIFNCFLIRVSPVSSTVTSSNQRRNALLSYAVNVIWRLFNELDVAVVMH